MIPIEILEFPQTKFARTGETSTDVGSTREQDVSQRERRGRTQYNRSSMNEIYAEFFPRISNNRNSRFSGIPVLIFGLHLLLNPVRRKQNQVLITSSVISAGLKF